MPTIDLGKFKYAWKGSYSASVQYEIFDLVKYTDGHIYICKATPPGVGYSVTNTTYWELYIQSASGMTTAGDLLYHDGTKITRLPKGTDGQVLTVSNGVPAWGSGSKFIQASSFIDRNTRSVSNAASVTVWSGTVTRTSATSMMIAHIVVPMHSDSGNGTAAPCFTLNSYAKHTITQHGPGPAGCVGHHGVVWFTASEGLGSSTGSLAWSFGYGAYDSTTAVRGQVMNPTNSNDSRAFPNANQEQTCTQLVIYEIEP